MLVPFWEPGVGTGDIRATTGPHKDLAPGQGCAGAGTSATLRGGITHRVPPGGAVGPTGGWRRDQQWDGRGHSPAAWLEPDWLIFPWQGHGVAICDRTFPGPLVLSKENKQGVVCMGRLASPGPGYGFLLFLAGIAGDSPACPDLASFSLLFFFFFFKN